VALGILNRVAKGEENAMAECLANYGGVVWGLARRRFPITADAEDAVQDVFAEVWRSASKFDPNIANELTFIMIIARRKMIDRQRRRLDPVFASQEEMPDPLDRNSASRLELMEEAQRAREMMQNLHPDERTVLEMTIDRGLTQSEISQKLDIPLGTVKTHARRGLLRLRDWLSSGREPVAGGGG
jgi:RNA polymerase sigma factor (sigma-70 family)